MNGRYRLDRYLEIAEGLFCPFPPGQGPDPFRRMGRDQWQHIRPGDHLGRIGDPRNALCVQMILVRVGQQPDIHGGQFRLVEHRRITPPRLESEIVLYRPHGTQHRITADPDITHLQQPGSTANPFEAHIHRVSPGFVVRLRQAPKH